MATNLYEVLELERTASPEEVRKAYRRLALQTHPDRQSADLPPTQKEAAAEQFRLVNNAYEVLSDPVKRQEYDIHGVWPPTEVPPARSYPHPPRASTMPTFGFDPFDSDPFGFFPGQQRSRGFDHPMHGFTDPFSLFDQIFGNSHGRSMGGMFSSSLFEDDDFFAMSPRRDMFNPFGSGMMGMGMGMGGMGMGGFGGPSRRGSNVRSYTSASRSFQSPRSGWVRESHMTRTVNGVTETIWKREDNGGNEHVTYTYPDGHERYTINGVDQAQPNGYQQPQVIQPASPPPAYPTVQQDVRMASPPDNYPAYDQYQPPSQQQQRGPPVAPPPGPPPTGRYAPAAERSRSGGRRSRSHKGSAPAHERTAEPPEGSRHRTSRAGSAAPPMVPERDDGRRKWGRS